MDQTYIFIRRMVLSLIWLALSGCATNVIVEIPMAEVQSPAVGGGHLKANLGFEYKASEDVEFVANGQSRPPVFGRAYEAEDNGVSKNTFDADGYLDASASLELWERAELGVSVAPFGGVYLLNAKVQLLGSSARAPQAGDPVVGVFGRAGLSRGSASGDQQTTFGPGGYPWEAKASVDVRGAGGSLGYRVSKTFLLYFGGAYDDYTARARVTQAPSATGDSAGGTYAEDSQGYSRTAALGFGWTWSSSTLDLTLSNSWLNWTGLPERIEPALNASFKVLIK